MLVRIYSYLSRQLASYFKQDFKLAAHVRGMTMSGTVTHTMVKLLKHRLSPGNDYQVTNNEL